MSNTLHDNPTITTTLQIHPALQNQINQINQHHYYHTFNINQNNIPQLHTIQ
jgi:hypothetical protein